MAGDQRVTLTLMQVLIQDIPDMENEFISWFQVFFREDVIEIGQIMGYFEKETIPRINAYFDVTVPMYSDSQFRMSRETVEVPTRMIGKFPIYFFTILM